MKKGVYILPNLITMTNMFCGFYAILSAIQGQYTYAATAIIGAAVFDFFDGKVARMTNSCSKFGMEFDSLADLVSFGMAPALLTYLWALKPFGRLGWGAAFLYLLCGALRLARYNIQSDSSESNCFTGLPIPAAASFLAGAVLFHSRFWNPYLEGASTVMMLVAYVLAFLMVSNVKYRSIKEVDHKRRKPFSLLVVLSLYLFILISEPQLVIFASISLYTLSGVYRLVKEKEKWLSFNVKFP